MPAAMRLRPCQPLAAPATPLLVLVLVLALAGALAGATVGEAPGAPDGAVAEAEAAATRATLAAIEQATPVRLAGGATTLDQALAQLVVNGNDTLLAVGVDGGQVAVLPAQQGTYWQAVLALCAAFDLDVAEMPRANASDEDPQVFHADDKYMPVQSGPVILCRRAPGAPRLLATAQGPLLMLVEALSIRQARPPTPRAAPVRWGELVLRALLEPRIAPTTIGSAFVVLQAYGAPGGKELEVADVELIGTSPFSLRLSLPELPPGGDLRLVGNITLAVGKAETLSGALRLGIAQDLVHGRHRMGVRLIDRETIQREKMNGPGLLCTFEADDLLRAPEVHVTVAGKDQQVIGHWHNVHDGIKELGLLFAQDPLMEEHQIEIHASYHCGDAVLPVACSFEFGALPPGDAPPHPASSRLNPTLLSWPSATLTLQQALALLRASGNAVLLEIGTDEAGGVALPAFNGTFWEGVLVVCRAYQLTVVAVVADRPEDPQLGDEAGILGLVRTVAPCAGGPVCLAHQRAGLPALESLRACGSLLTTIAASQPVLTHSRAGVERALNLDCRLRLEPRLDAALLGSSWIMWQSCVGGDGRNLGVELPILGPRQRQDGHEVDLDALPAGLSSGRARPADVPPWTVAVVGVSAGATRLHLGGVLVGDVGRQLRTSFALAPGQRQAVAVGEHMLLVTFLGQAEARALGLPDAAIAISGTEAVGSSMELQLRTPQGELLEPLDTTKLPSSLPYDMVVPYGNIAEHAYQLVLHGSDTIVRLGMPVEFAIAVP